MPLFFSFMMLPCPPPQSLTIAIHYTLITRSVPCLTFAPVLFVLPYPSLFPPFSSTVQTVTEKEQKNPNQCRVSRVAYPLSLFSSLFSFPLFVLCALG
ncbi:hypothetical protein BKA57DRAFT_63825 [Linnemannia elongata]|nr:hypothetical protein BKA57DRAFT_63825 [Linnemannia elongata]